MQKAEEERHAMIRTTLIEIPKVGFFKMVDVDGDGSCFFSALCVAPEIRMEDPYLLRQKLCDFLQHNKEAHVIYTNILKETLPYDSFVRTLRRHDTWGGISAAVFVCLMMNVNIVIISNAYTGLICNDIRKWEHIHFIDKSASTIYLYHHYYKKPFTKSRTCNHFAYLFHYEGKGISEAEISEAGFQIYRNPYKASSPSEFVISSNNNPTSIEHQTK